MGCIAAFTIPYPQGKTGKSAFCRQYGLNAYYTGKFWKVRMRDAEALHLLATAAMRKAGVLRELVTEPVEVCFHWDDGLDLDNHAILGKAFLDAMKGTLLPDDNRKWVRRITHEFWRKGCIGVEIRQFQEDGGKQNGIS